MSVPIGYTPHTVDRTCLLKLLPPQSPGDGAHDDPSDDPPPYDGIIVPGGPGNASYSVKKERSQQDSSIGGKSSTPGQNTGKNGSNLRPKAVTSDASMARIHVDVKLTIVTAALGYIVSSCAIRRR